MRWLLMLRWEVMKGVMSPCALSLTGWHFHFPAHSENVLRLPALSLAWLAWTHNGPARSLHNPPLLAF